MAQSSIQILGCCCSNVDDGQLKKANRCTQQHLDWPAVHWPIFLILPLGMIEVTTVVRMGSVVKALGAD